MLLEIICFLCGAGLAVTGSLFFWPVHYWYDFYRPLLLFMAGCVASLAILFLLEWLAGLFINQKKEYNKVSPWARFWLMNGLRFISNHAHIWVKTTGLNKVPQKDKFVLVCNHRSKFDNFVISLTFRNRDIAFISKVENAKIPIVGPFFPGVCYIPIDREDKLQSLQAFKRAVTLLQNDAVSIGVFPEGTRQTEKVIGDEFHEGVFNIAIHAKAPIVVTCMKNSDKVHKRWPFRATLVKYDVVAVIPYEEYQDMPAKQLSDTVHKMMEEHLARM